MGDMHTSACLHCHHTPPPPPPPPRGLQEYREYCYTSDVFKGVAWDKHMGVCIERGGGGGGGGGSGKRDVTSIFR